MKKRIQTESAIEWARTFLTETPDGTLVAGEMTDDQLQEYLIAHGITTDGIFQDHKPAWSNPIAAMISHILRK